MRVLVGGSRNWVDYSHVMRKVTVLLEELVKDYPEDKKIVFVHSGSTPAENMVTEYIGKVDKLLSQNGYSIKEQIIKSTPDKFVENIFTMSDLNLDKAIFFIRDSCKWTQNFANVSSAIGIPTEIVKG